MSSWRERAVLPVLSPLEAVMRVTEGLAQRGLIKKGLYEVAPDGVNAVRDWLAPIIREEDHGIIDLLADEIIEMRSFFLSMNIPEQEFSAR